MSEFRYQSGVRTKIERRADGVYDITVNGVTYRVEDVRAEEGRLLFRVDGVWQTAHYAQEGAARHVAWRGGTHTLIKAESQRQRRSGAREGGGSLSASMHSQVISVLVTVGDAVVRGQPLVVLEAMKMEMRITAPVDGVVTMVSCAPGQIVEKGQVLVAVE
ncbi:MAG TPA: hypothetical protein PLD47_09450 [Aggregatilineales bacterium]|nr:biotin/lipoyl-binding protein [Anaerolineales bacterium]HRE47939.1 hypothetical protein [Aggregatilineales bacterium]